MEYAHPNSLRMKKLLLRTNEVKKLDDSRSEVQNPFFSNLRIKRWLLKIHKVRKLSTDEGEVKRLLLKGLDLK